MSEQAVRSKTVDKFIPWFFVLFFIVLAVLDGIFVTIALKTHTGTVTERSYERGLDYNRTLAAARRQQALGWQDHISLVDGQKIEVTLTDDRALPLEGVTVTAKATRPVQAGYDFTLNLQEQGGGIYSAPAEFALPGQWQVRIFATWQDKQYQSSQTIIVP